jgi:hypothetical protein
MVLIRKTEALGWNIGYYDSQMNRSEIEPRLEVDEKKR